MAELRVPPGFANAHWKFTLTGDPEPMSFALGLQLDDAVSDPDDFASDLADAFGGALGYGANHWYNQFTFVGVDVTIGNDGPEIVGHNTRATTGTGGSNATLPNNCAAIFKKSTGFAGRKFRGRLYMPPISLAEADVNNVGIIDAGVVTAVQGYWDSFETQLTGLSVSVSTVLLHTSGAVDPTPITNIQLENQIATQRRRLRG